MDPKTNAPTGDYVLSFGELLEKAENSPLGLQNSPLQLTSEQRTDISKLNEFRGDLEHVKPRSWLLAVGGLPRMGANVARTFAALLPSFSHQLEPEEIEQVETAVAMFEQLGLKHPSSPPAA